MAVRHPGSRLIVWLRRYGPAELVSLVVTISCSWLALALSDSVLLAALIGTWAENIAYYGMMVRRELWADGRPSLNAVVSRSGRLLIEFAPAELLDSLLVRPAALAAGLALAPSPTLGALAGKLVADAVFYLPTILSYELLRRRERANSEEVFPC